MKYFKFIVCLLFGLFFIYGGLKKLFHFMPMEATCETAKK